MCGLRRCVPVRFGFGVSGLGFGICGLAFGGWGLEFGVWGLGLVWSVGVLLSEVRDTLDLNTQTLNPY